MVWPCAVTLAAPWQQRGAAAHLIQKVLKVTRGEVQGHTKARNLAELTPISLRAPPDLKKW